MDLWLLLAATVVLIATPHPAVTGERSLESVPDLEKSMYRNVEGYPCIRRLNISGEIGCSNPGRENIVAPILRLNNTKDQLSHLSAYIVPLDEMQNFFIRVSNDPNFAKSVAGVLVESTGFQNLSLGISPDEKFPQAKFAPYRNLNYEWNPSGSGIMRNQYNFPVFLLSGESISIVQELASKNEKRTNHFPLSVAEFDLVMQTTTVGSKNSESCLKHWSCLPLGGYSVWSSLKPINFPSTKLPKPVLLAIASQDSASFFRDQGLGADSPSSGLIALLTAVDALSHVDGLEELKKQLVFAIFTGEAWGYLGSRRFLLELDTNSEAVSGINSTMIQQIVEVGSVGKGLGKDAATFFAHTGGDSASTKEILSAFDKASVSLGSDNVTIKRADASNPGVPPSSLMSFLRKNSSTSGVVMEEFDSSFTNKFYQSPLDNASNINSSSIAAAAALVARALYILASGDLPLNLMKLNSIRVNVSLVEELIGCLTCDPGFSCELVKDYISPTSSCPSHDVGVLFDSSPDTQYPENVGDISRFIWNFMADRTSTPEGNTSSCTGKCSGRDEVCIRAETSSGGRCVKSTTRYVPAYSTRLKFEDNSWHVVPANSSDSMGLVDPVWTESNWDTINLRVYTVQSSSYDRLVLFGGFGITVATYFGVIIARARLSRALKHD